ncbi:agamous-like MADS-box protein AGL80 [Eutrema salsugineum]|uniref:agamous-like MADS-box protein AGL80 n=1 Tax=Eutrema salsugineum TaxID=72664 RepID=UPI000CECE613|nr:agamous-like MADS-box protein AGL80 [Eutrema salsugineum]
MTRKKVKLAFIANESSRKATFKKRKKGLIKKVNELSTLCGITACAIIYSPYDSNPEVWPSNSGVQRVISDLRMLPQMDQHKKMVDQESFLKQRIAKASEHLKRQNKDNREMEMTEVMFQCLVGKMGMFDLNIMDLNDLGYLIEQNLKEINRRIEILGNAGVEIGESSNAAAAMAPSSKGIGSLALTMTTTAPTTTIHRQQHQQQFRHPVRPHGGFYERIQNLNLNQNNNQNQNQQKWLMEIMNHPEQMCYAAENMGFSFIDDNHNCNHHQQQISGDYYTALTIVNSSSSIPVSNSNPTNNI